MSTRDIETGRFLARAPKTARKLFCPRCGKRKWKRDFYRIRSGNRKGQYYTYCKECCSEIKMQRYAYREERTILCRDGTVRHIIPNGPGRRGASCRLDWSAPMLERLRRDFATTRNEDLAIDLGVSVRTLIRKARELGLAKSPAWIKRLRDGNLKMMRFINKLHPNGGMFRKGRHASPATEFKKKDAPARRQYKETI